MLRCPPHTILQKTLVKAGEFIGQSSHMMSLVRQHDYKRACALNVINFEFSD